MITLSTIITLFVILGWLKHYDNYKKGKCHLNIFDDSPTILTFPLVFATAYVFVLLIYLIVKYLP